MKEFSDKEIIDGLKNRQSYVVRYLQERYLPMIRLHISRNNGSNEDAKDIFQEGLIILIEKIDDNSFTLTCSFKTYLYSICKHLWNEVLEKRGAASRYAAGISEEYEKDASESIDNSVYEEIFRSAFDSLEPASRNILKLYWQDMSPQDIADKLGLSYNYVRKKKSEAQAELTEKVKAHPHYRLIMKTV